MIEMVVVTSLIAIISVFLVNLVVTSQNALLIENTAAPVRAQAKQAMETMEKELREADPSSPTPGGVTIGGSGTSQSITFYIPDDVSKTQIDSWKQITYAHDADEKQIARTESGTSTIIGRDISGLQFSTSNNVVTITVTASKTISGGTGTIQFPLISQVRLRN